MNNLPYIRNLFTPIQPTVRQKGDSVSYREILPCVSLQSYIYCYWELKTEEPLSDPFSYRVVSDGCIDIVMEAVEFKDCFVMGFCKKYTEYELGNYFRYVGIRFLPTMFPQLFRIDAAKLANRYEVLELVLPKVSNFVRSEINTSQSLLEMQESFDEYFLNHIHQVDFDEDHRFYEALNIILQANGVLQVEKELNTGLSPRQLRRKFQYYLGTSPKTFGKVVRFQNILRAKPSTQSLKKNKLFFEVGYYDQAHFIKEFKNFYGVTPSKAFGR